MATGGRWRSSLVAGFAFIAVLASATLAVASIPPELLAQQQERAVRVYCAHWRRTHRNQALEGNQIKQVITDLQVQYPAVFSECRSERERICRSWLDALVQGLRRYGKTSLRAVCGNSNPQEAFPPP